MQKYSYDISGNVIAEESGSVELQILGQPVTLVSEPGEVVSFSVTLSDGSGATFQWKFKGADIPGATGDSLLLTNVSAAMEGQYSVVITSGAGSVTSAPAALMLDSDGDGLPDSWEIANFGNLNQRGGGDFDGDGISNLDEFFDGTDPKDKNSFRPRLIAYGDGNGSVSVTPTQLSYDRGQTVMLAATAFAPSAFVGWAGDLGGNANPAPLKLDINKLVRARFALVTPMPPGLIAYWRGETDASDLLGASNGSFFSGTSQTAPTTTPNGKVGGAFSFDGTVYVQVPDSPSLRPTQFTAEAWVFPTVQINAYQAVIAKGSSKIDAATWFMGILNGQFHFVTFPSHLLAAPSPVPLNQWTHMAISFDGRTKKIYVNGLLVASASGLGPVAYDPSPVPVTIGSAWAFNASSHSLTGLVDEVALYDRALNADEILAIYNADFLGKNLSQPYFTSPSLLSDVAVGGSYHERITATRGASPLTFSVSKGALPPGIDLSSQGNLDGSSSVPGTFDFTVRATDVFGNFNEQMFIFRVTGSATLPPDAVAWWRGEPAADGAVPDNIGGHEGGFFIGNGGAGPSYAEGKVAGAFSFDGSIHVRVPDALELHPTEMTAEAWVFPTAITTDHQSVIARGSSTNADVTWWMGLLNGTPRFLSKHLGSPVSALDAPSPIPLNGWTHLAITFDGDTRQLYVNGLAVASQTGLGAFVYDPAAIPITIGSDIAFNASASGFKGRVDEVTLYRRGLSADEIFSIFDAGAAGKHIAGPYINSQSELSAGAVGQSYTTTFTSIQGTAPVSFAFTEDSISPAGLTLTSQGILNGSPTNPGSFEFGVRATDAAGAFYVEHCSLKIFQSVAAPAGLVGWWKAEGNAKDSTDSNDGALHGGASFATGQIGQAFLLDGVDGCVEIADTPALRLASVTLEAWVSFDVTSGIRVVFAKPLGSGTFDSYALWLQGSLNGVVSDIAGLGPIIQAPFAPAPGRWYHLAYTFNSQLQQQELYIDGERVAVGGVTKSIGYDAQPLLLGRDTENGVPSFFLKGRIDEASIYDRALNGEEILAIYNAGPQGKRLQ
jgi:hypothetical protein